MLKFVCISVLITFVCGSPTIKTRPPALDGRIVGGSSTTIDKYPYQISLQIAGNHACGGSLVSTRHVVTAAHCTVNQVPKNLRIRAGSSYHSAGGQLVDIDTIYQHPNYDAVSQDNDIAILLLSEEVTNSNAQTISLVSAGTSIPVGGTATVTGWGLTQEDGNVPTQLQTLDVPVLSQSDCEDSYETQGITDSMFCAGYLDGGKDACQGDSGGPLAYNGQLIGVVSWGVGCARPNYPGVYSNVAKLRDFIDSIVG